MVNAKSHLRLFFNEAMLFENFLIPKYNVVVPI